MVTTEPLAVANEISFKPDPRVALGQQIAFGILGLIIATVAHYLETRDNFLKSAALGTVGGVAVVAIMIFRNRKRGYASLHLGAEALTIEDNKGRTVLLWNEISKAVHYLHGEERWEFHVEAHKEPIRYALYGFLPPDLKAIQGALVERIRCLEERTPMEGPRPISA